MNNSSSNRPAGVKVFSGNKRAYYEYEVIDRMEGGLVLTGAEVKSVKAGAASIKEAFVQIEDDEAWLWGAHIPLWRYSRDTSYDPTKKRKVLLHRSQIDTLTGKSREKGITLIPLKLYGVRGKVKVEIGVCRGKRKYEKRQREKERQMKKELHREKRKYMV